MIRSARSYGGAETLARLLQRELSRRVQFRTYTLSVGEASQIYKDAAVGGHIFGLGFLRDLRSADIVLASDRSAILLGYLLSLVFRFQVIGIVHGQSKSNWIVPVYNWVARRIARTVFVTDQLKTRYSGQTEEPVFPNFCDELVCSSFRKKGSTLQPVDFASSVVGGWNTKKI